MRNKVDYRAIAGIALVAALSLVAITQALFAQIGPPAPKRAPGIETTDLLVDPAGQPIRVPLNQGKAEPPQKPGEVEPSLFPEGVPGLEEIISAALQENPDIRVAQAKVREAEAALNQARLEMIRQAVTLRQSTLQQQAEFKETKRLYANNVISAAELAQSSRAAIKSEAQLLYLMGRTPPGTAQAGAMGSAMSSMAQMMAGGQKGPGMIGPGPGALGAQGMMGPMGMGGMGGGAGGGWIDGQARPAIPKGKMAEQLRAALDKETSVDFFQESLANMISVLAESTGLNIVAAEDLDSEAKVTLTLKKTPLGAALQALRDRAHVDFIVRDYGILVTNENNGPEDGLLAHEFWQLAQPQRSQ